MRRRGGRRLRAGLGITGAVSSAADTGDQKRAVDQQIQDIQGALDETSADLANAYNALQATQSQLPAAQAALTQAEDAEHTANQHNDEIAAQLAVAQANEQRAVETQTANKAKLDQTQSVLDNFAADLFQGGGGGSQMSVALGATSADDFATRVVLADQVTSLDRQRAQGAPERPRRGDGAGVLPQGGRGGGHPAQAGGGGRRWPRPRPPAPRRPRPRPTSTTSLAQQSAYAARGRVEEGRRAAAARRRRGRAGQAPGHPRGPGARRSGRRGGSGGRGSRGRTQLRPGHRRRRLPQPRRQRADHLAVRAAVPPDPARLEAPLRHRLRRPVRHPGRWRPPTAPSSAPATAAGTATASSSTTASCSGVDLASTYNHLSSFVVKSGRSPAASSSPTPARPATPPAATCTSRRCENGQFVDPMKWL